MAGPNEIDELQAWIAASELHVSADGTERMFESLEGIRVRRVAPERYLVALVGQDGAPLVGLANHDNCRAICRTVGVVIPDDDNELVYGTGPLFGLPADALSSLMQEEEYRAPLSGNLNVLTIASIPGRTIIESLGMVMGSTVRARHLGAKLAAGVSQNFGGELGGYTRLLQGARDEAVARMVDEARALHADTVVGFRLATAELFDQAIEMLAYGTAVRTIATTSDP